MSDVVDLTARIKVVHDKKSTQNAAKQIVKDIKDGMTNIDKASKKGSISFKSFKDIQESFKNLRKEAGKALKPIASLMDKIGRIWLYRSIRAGLKAISDALREGTNNLYQWSKLQGSTFGNSFYQSMNKMSTALLYFKNAIATVTAPLLEVFADLIDRVTDVIVRCIEKLSMFVGYLTNSGYYLKATKYNIAYAASVKAVQNALLGFDELNIISKNDLSDTIQNYQNLFEEIPLDNKGNFATTLGFKIKDIVFNWDNLKLDQIIDKIVTGLWAVTGLAVGWHIGGVGGAVVGAVLGASIGFIISALADFEAGVSYNEKQFASLLKVGLMGVIGGVLGFLVTGNVVGGLLGMSLGVSLELLIQNVDWTNDTGKQKLTDNLQLEKSIAGDYDAIDAQLKSQNNKLKNTWANLLTNTSATYNYSVADIDYRKLHARANGGTVPTGDLFIAGESGAELVSHIGGRNTVYNEEQLGNSLAYANESVVNAINTLIGVVKSKSNNVQISANDIRKAVNTSNMRLGV